ncbi:MAG: radical SAM protein [Holophagae bacterium]
MTSPETGGPAAPHDAGREPVVGPGLAARMAALVGTGLRRANHRCLPGRLLHGPEWLVLGVNNVCNLHCRMCDVGQAATDTIFARNLLGSSPRDMPMELVERVVDQTARHFPSARLGFAFTEPLIYPHLVEAVTLANHRGIATAVTSNGLTLRRQAADLSAAGLDDLFLSIDGPPALHDRIRGRDGAFDRAMAGVDRVLTDERRPRVSIFCVVSAWNQDHLTALLELLSDLPLERVGFMHPNFTTEEVAREHNRRYGDRYPATWSNLGPFNPNDVDLERLRLEIDAVRVRHWPFPVAFSPELRTADELDCFYRRPGTLIGHRCSDAFRTLMVKSDGRVIPAHGRCYDVTVGNLHDQSLPEIWNSPELGRFRRTLNRAGGLLPACARCCSAF